MNNFIFGQYFPGTSFLYRLNPVLKLIVTILLIVASFLNHRWLGFVILLVICGMTIQLTHVSWKFFLKGTSFFFYMILFTTLLQALFSQGGQVYWQWGIFTISSFGLQVVSLAFFRFVIAIIILTVLLMTTDPADIAQTIQKVCYPLKFIGVNLDDIGLVVAIALRFVPTLTGEISNIRNAQLSRGVNFGKQSVIEKIKKMGLILVPLFMNVFRRADQLASAMILRGYTDGKQRTHLRQMKWNWLDWFILLFMILILGLIVSLNLKK